MVVVYGDYKDLNFVGNFFRGSPQSLRNQMEMEFLYPYWEKFVKCEYHLEEKYISDEEWRNSVWIDIRNIVFTENEYTSYGIVSPSPFRPFQAWKKYDSKYIDKKEGIVVTESLISDGYNPSFEEVKRREIEYAMKYNAKHLKKWREKDGCRWFV